jgi:UDP-N-acetylmuramyl tripeptide synthase
VVSRSGQRVPRDGSRSIIAAQGPDRTGDDTLKLNDAAKRELVAELDERRADLVIVANDDCHTEAERKRIRRFIETMDKIGYLIVGKTASAFDPR